MKSVFFAPLLAGIGYALPQGSPSCETTVEQVIVPTSTATYYTTEVTTIHATTPQDLGTYTEIIRESSTRTLQTITSTDEAGCAINGTSASPVTSTSYTTASDPDSTSSPQDYPTTNPALLARQESACTVTSTSTTTYGETYTFLPAQGETSTFTQHTAFTQATITSTSTGGTAYAIATATAEAPCSDAASATKTVTHDARCAPSALVSAAGANPTSPQYGLDYANDVPSGGAVYRSDTTDASACCQLCVEEESCAASLWDSRTGDCRLEFPVQWDSGELNCGMGALVFYGAGPASPMEPGEGLWVGTGCGSVQYSNAKPDDGT